MLQTAFATALAVLYVAYGFLFFEFPIPTLTAAVGIVFITAYEIKNSS